MPPRRGGKCSNPGLGVDAWAALRRPTLSWVGALYGPIQLGFVPEGLLQ